MGLIELPAELRLNIYEYFLLRHTRIKGGNQPNNSHLALARVCRTIHIEATPLLHTYISLRTEHQISKFVYHVDASRCNVVTWADVANDGRVMLTPQSSPVSRLFLALRKMTGLKCLRVFDCKSGVRAPDGPRFHGRVILKSEEAMFPDDGAMARSTPIETYKLCVSPTTRSTLFTNIPPTHICTLRLSGDCIFPDASDFSSLRELILDAVTGNHFDRRALDSTFTSSRLETFCYRMGGMGSLELRDSHLESLRTGIGTTIRRLALVGCSRLTGNGLAALFDQLRNLTYLALDMITVRQLQVGFIRVLSPKLELFKFAITNVSYAQPLIAEEVMLCDEIESLIDRDQPPQSMHLKLRDEVLQSSGRWAKWETMVKHRGIDLRTGVWGTEELQ
ncbi:hypothetical protein K488DRAFT_45870 [Vararia minispora EC-137]|uniref:Uncharacterized protein n=1 Tax=Vararia minispora EC-137 TaxID=1314806 RepID=A0ACB8QSB2_9AGAM|nr:hypothetical protein K488DRAFT_45870 [Vararia minispora EC-137]